MGLSLTAYITVRLEKHSETHKRKPMDAFRASVQTWPDVVECSSLTGEMDYLLRVLVSDMAHYSRFVMDTLLKHPSVQDCKTSFVLDRVKQTTAVPLQETKTPLGKFKAGSMLQPDVDRCTASALADKPVSLRRAAGQAPAPAR